MSLAVEGLNESDCKFRDGFGGISGDVGDEETEGFSGGQMDVVEACAPEKYSADTVGVEGTQNRLIEGIVYENANGVAVMGQWDGLFGESEGMIVNVEGGILRADMIEVGSIVSFGAEDCKLHGF